MIKYCCLLPNHQISFHISSSLTDFSHDAYQSKGISLFSRREGEEECVRVSQIEHGPLVFECLPHTLYHTNTHDNSPLSIERTGKWIPSPSPSPSPSVSPAIRRLHLSAIPIPNPNPILATLFVSYQHRTIQQEKVQQNYRR